MIGSQGSSRTNESHQNHFEDTYVEYTDRKKYSHDGRKHNLDINFLKIQGRIKMKGNPDSHSRNRNVQRYNLYISKITKN